MGFTSLYGSKFRFNLSMYIHRYFIWFYLKLYQIIQVQDGDGNFEKNVNIHNTWY